MVTVMGKFLDPLADKLMVMAMLVMLVALNRLPASLVVILLAREMTINGLRAIASSEGLVISAGEMGKYKTALQMIGVMCLLIHYPYTVYFLGLHQEVVNFNLVGTWILIVSVLISVLSAAGYITNFFKALDEREGRAPLTAEQEEI
jgi:CDP-diacylglycerol--glycerol-3-phosphate 3-phosphatidyltransferase